MNGLLTDLYQLTMAAGYFASGKAEETATFELQVRRLPKNRNFLVAAGLAQAVDYLTHLSFSDEELRYVRRLPQFSRTGDAFFDYLRDLRFSGAVEAVPEGSVVFPGEPILNVTAPLIQAQIVETYLLGCISFQTLIASKAARVVAAAQGRPVIEFGTRRAHSPEAGVLGARAAYMGGCAGSSNVLAGMRFGFPVFGTAAHSWVMAFADAGESFRRLQDLLGEGTIYIVDTIDTIEGTRKAAALGQPLWGIRIDSGDLGGLARQCRQILDQAGLPEAKILASGDLDEWKIAALLEEGAPIDSFGVGTELATSADDPRLSAIYKLVEIRSGDRTRYTAKYSEDKSTLPGRKQIVRFADYDLVGRAGEEHEEGQPLLQQVIRNGQRMHPLPSATHARDFAIDSLSRLPEALRSLEPVEPYPVRHSEELRDLALRIRQETIEPS